MIVVPQLAFSAARVASGDELPPVARVCELVRLGASEVQLLDLDGALALEGVLPEWVASLVAIAKVPVRFDGRLSDAHAVEQLTRARFATVVIDHAALFDASLVRWALDIYGAKLCVEVQADGEYLFDPPPHAFALDVVEALTALHLQGVRRVLLRDVTARDLDMDRVRELIERVPGIAISYAGPVRDVADVVRLAPHGSRIEAVLVDADGILADAFDLAAANRAVAVL